MERTIHFIAGLPRSGSTLLCNLLAQNPRFHATSTSGIINVVRLVRERWANTFGPSNPANEAAKRRVMGGILEYYHDDPEAPKPVVFDKSRGWLGVLEMAEAALGRKVKVLVCVRDVRDVLASFERLWRKNTGTWQFGQEGANFYQWQTLEGRCEVWMRANQVVGSAYNRIKMALVQGQRDRMHFVEFEELASKPKETMQRVYDFIGEASFDHDFDHVEQVTWEDDFMHGIPGLHVVRPKVEPVESQWPKYLGDVAKKYANLNQLWRGPKGRPTAPSQPAVVGAVPPVATSTSTTASRQGPRKRPGARGRR